MKKVIYSFICILIISASSLYGADWFSWRGPDRNGISPETGLNLKSLNDPKINWSIETGKGYSIVAVKEKYVYTMGYDGDKNVIYCLNADTGKIIWKYDYKCGSGTQYTGPRATPALDGNNVYTFSQDGHLICQDAGTGKVLWQHNIADEFNVNSPQWNFASSVLILGNILYINAGKNGMAFDKNTGAKVWFSGTNTGNYSTPVPFVFKNKSYLGIFGEKELFAVDASSGKAQWSFDWSTRYDVIAADPLFIGEKVFVSSGYRRGCSMWDFSKGKPEKLWENKNISAHFTSPVLIGNFIYGIDGDAGYGNLTCIEASTGKKKWSKNTGFGSLIATKDNYLVVITERGSLLIVKADPESYQEIARKDKLMNRLCWTPPVISNGNLYLRNDQGTLMSISLK